MKYDRAKWNKTFFDLRFAQVRNKRITGAYAELAKQHPDKFIWMGTASEASAQVGKLMGTLQGMWEDEKRSRRDSAIVKGFITFGFDKLAEGNLAVYSDLYWQHLAFADGGIDLIRKIRENDPSDLTQRHLAGWEKIASGIQNKNAQDIFAGNVMLFRYEQEKILQEVAFGPIKLRIDLAKVPPLSAIREIIIHHMNGMAYAPYPPHMSFEDWAKENKVRDRYFLNLEQRFRWAVETGLKGYENLLGKDLNRLLQMLDARIAEEKAYFRKQQ